MAKIARRAANAQARTAVAVGALLFGVVWLVFGRSLTHGFVNFDDEVYVYQNPRITAGLTSDSIPWAFTHSHARNWHPLTTLSHMLDVQIFGLNAGGHHFTNVLLHSVSAVLLFFVLRRMTGELFRAGFAAALFAIHPLRVESVAWIAERKDVLSGLFFVLTLAAYVRYAERPRSRGAYAAVIICFAAGLLSKPMLVTLPLILLVLDFWPLRRFDNPRRAKAERRTQEGSTSMATWRPLIIEKLPLIALSAGSCVATLLAQGGSVGALEPMPLMWRISNSLVTAIVYLLQIVWPVNLAPFYPYSAGTISVFATIGAAVVLVGITALAVLSRRAQPWLFAGWCWYLIMLLPVIGIVQIGTQARADRYTYLPQIGIYFAATWTIAEFAKRRNLSKRVVAIAAAVFLGAMAFLAWRQTGYWRDSQTLWTHAAAVTRDNEVAENNLGILLEHDGKLDDAIAHYERAAAIQRERGQRRYSLTLALSENNLGNAFAQKGELARAILHYRSAVDLRPDYADGWYNLGTVLMQRREPDAALDAMRKAIAMRPDDAAVHGRLGDLYRMKGSDENALAEYEKAFQLEPRALWADHSLAWLLATSADGRVRNPQRAIRIAIDAVQLPNGATAVMFRALAAAYAANGEFSEAIAAAEQGVSVANLEGDAALLRSLRADIDLYRSNVPLRTGAAVR